MSRARVAVLQVVSKQSTVTAAAAESGISRRHLQRLLVRYREGGLEALEPRSRRPKTTPIETPGSVRERIVELRAALTADGLDAGPETIRWHLEREGLGAPSTSEARAPVSEARPLRVPARASPLYRRGRSACGDAWSSRELQPEQRERRAASNAVGT